HELTFISNELNEDTLVYCFGKEILILNSLQVLNQGLREKLKDLGIKQIICCSDFTDQFALPVGVDELIKKYNVAAPRYTSYPTVPYWDTENWNKKQWVEKVKITHAESLTEGISIYIHLPFCE